MAHVLTPTHSSNRLLDTGIFSRHTVEALAANNPDWLK
jgi:hypothetical protein